MKKIDVVFVTAEVQSTRNTSIIGCCIRRTMLSAQQCETFVERLHKTMGHFGDKIRWAYFNHATIFWIEKGAALCRQSLRREMRRFGRTLEAVGIVECAEICSPFKANYR